MHIVAIYDLKDDKETLAGSLASALGVTNYEALSRLRSPGDGPFTVSISAEKEKALLLAERLQSAGFKAVVLTDKDIEDEDCAWLVVRFVLNDQDLIVEAGNDKKISIQFKDIDLILRGTGIAGSDSTETVKNRSLNLGRAVLSGGLILSKTTKTVRDVTVEERESFVNLYCGENPILVFRENSLAYDSLGAALKMSRKENFAYLVSEFLRLCPCAEYDERLLTRPAQVALLGPVLSPEKNLHAATALLAKVLRGRF
jgi:hypothetical protein